MKEIHKIGFGTWKIDKNVCSQHVYDAIKVGYRHIDCACDYGNEVEVGLGIKKAIDENICTREDLFITSKLWNTYHKREHVALACKKSLQDLGLEYLDLYLIHFPITLKFVPFETKYPPEWIFDSEKNSMELDKVPLQETWFAMEELVHTNLVKHLGICNFNSGLIHDLMSYVTIKPKMLQIESHPYLTQENLIKTAKTYDVEVTAFSPLGALSYIELDMSKPQESIIELEEIKELAKGYNKTPAQIILRWGIQRGTSIIPKTSKIERMIENISLFDFELTQNEMNQISKLNCNKRFNDPAKFCKEAFNTFHSIYD
jgi:D-xylose reductase